MIEVHRNLFVGSQNDEVSIRGQSGWFVIHACKEPYHREALGYTGRAARKSHPEYLIAKRSGRLILNLVDAPDVNYISSEIIDAALNAIHENITVSRVLVHCNVGQSRSPAIAFLYLTRFSDIFRSQDYQTSLGSFQKIYTSFNPAQGIADYVRVNWHKYSSSG
jgi:hypothetical protein